MIGATGALTRTYPRSSPPRPFTIRPVEPAGPVCDHALSILERDLSRMWAKRHGDHAGTKHLDSPGRSLQQPFDAQVLHIRRAEHVEPVDRLKLERSNALWGDRGRIDASLVRSGPSVHRLNQLG